MTQQPSTSSIILRGMRDGVPIGMGYLAVSFSLGIAAHNAGMTTLQGFIMSLLNVASAGEYAGISAIVTHATLLEVIMLSVVANARYTLMSCSLSQKFDPEMPFFHRLLVGFGVTDELFGIGIAYPGYLRPCYMYGAFATSIPLWAIGTALGVAVGSMLPPDMVNALSAAIYGMFIAIVVPVCRTNKSVMIVALVSLISSWLLSVLPFTAGISESFRIILLTVVISVAAAAAMPLPPEPEEEKEAAA